MTTVLPRLATGINSSTDPSVLQTLGSEGVSLALWQRTLPEQLIVALDELPVERLPQLRRRVTVRNAATAIHSACDEVGAGSCATLLADVVKDLSAHAVRVLASPVLQLRLDVTDGQPCPKWHVDAVPGRMLCTLRGPGTEFGPIGPDGAPETIQRMPRGWVGVFRGALWPARELAAVLHRSPPREAGGPRLLLVIDPVDDAGTC